MGSWIERATGGLLGSSAELIILQEHCAGGDLSVHVKEAQEQKRKFPESTILRWISQLVHALYFCHRVCRVLHRDMKPSNVFLSPKLDDVKLGDFGIARLL